MFNRLTSSCFADLNVSTISLLWKRNELIGYCANFRRVASVAASCVPEPSCSTIA